MWDITHDLAHILIFCGYIAGGLLVPRAFGALMSISLVTAISATGFFVTCGVTHLALSGDPSQESLIVEINDHLQAVFIFVFMVALSLDLRNTVKRLHQAYIAIGVKYGEKSGGEIVATIRRALEG